MELNYWERMVREFMRHLETIARHSGEPYTQETLLCIANSCPLSRSEWKNRKWQTTSFFAQCVRNAYEAPKTASQTIAVNGAIDYFLWDFVSLPAHVATEIHGLLLTKELSEWIL